MTLTETNDFMKTKTKKSCEQTGQMAQILRKMHKLEQALRVINIWAKFDGDSNDTREKAMADIRKMSGEALGS